MNKYFKNLLTSSSLCLILATSALACEKHQSNKVEDTTQYVAKNKKFGSKVPSTINEKARQQRFLSYRGFSSEHYNNLLG